MTLHGLVLYDLLNIVTISLSGVTQERDWKAIANRICVPNPELPSSYIYMCRLVQNIKK